MIIDIHTHLVSKKFNKNNFFTNFALNLFLHKNHFVDYYDYLEIMKTKLEWSRVDKAILVAVENSNECAGNEEVIEVCRDNPQFLFGANLNPYDKNIAEQFEEIVKNNAVLVKVIPSYQRVDLSDENCKKFFELLLKYDLPLLVHTGVEHSLASPHQELNNPQKLEQAAQMGVKIICAHCGSRIFLHEKSYFKEWEELALKYDNVYGDISAMINPVGKMDLDKILKNPKLAEKVIFGTDYPAFPLLRGRDSCDNIFEDCLNYFEKAGFDETIFTNAEKLFGELIKV